MHISFHTKLHFEENLRKYLTQNLAKEALTFIISIAFPSRNADISISTPELAI